MALQSLGWSVCTRLRDLLQEHLAGRAPVDVSTSSATNAGSSPGDPILPRRGAGFNNRDLHYLRLERQAGSSSPAPRPHGEEPRPRSGGHGRRHWLRALPSRESVTSGGLARPVVLIAVHDESRPPERPEHPAQVVSGGSPPPTSIELWDGGGVCRGWRLSLPARYRRRQPHHEIKRCPPVGRVPGRIGRPRPLFEGAAFVAPALRGRVKGRSSPPSPWPAGGHHHHRGRRHGPGDGSRPDRRNARGFAARVAMSPDEALWRRLSRGGLASVDENPRSAAACRYEEPGAGRTVPTATPGGPGGCGESRRDLADNRVATMMRRRRPGLRGPSTPWMAIVRREAPPPRASTGGYPGHPATAFRVA